MLVVLKNEIPKPLCGTSVGSDLAPAPQSVQLSMTGSQPWQLKVTYSWWTAAAPLQLTPLKHSTFKADSVLGSMLASLWCCMERCWVSVNLRFARSFQDSSWLPRVQGFHKVKESHSRKHSRMHCEPEASILLSPFIPTREIFSNPVSVLFLSKQFFVSTA